MKLDETIVESLLRQRGAATAKEICQALKVSQPTVSRWLSRLGSRVLRLGRGRTVRYAMVRDIGTLGSNWPVYEIGEDGRPALVGTLWALQGRRWAFVQEDAWESLRGNQFALGLYPDLPWFLEDLRPQGFLGRAFARKHARALGLGPDPRVWSADSVLEVLLRYGQELPGAFVIGEQMLQQAQERRLAEPATVDEADRVTLYGEMADQAIAGEWPGSSAAGEQPKFTACVRRDGLPVSVIVKFSGSAGRPEDQRWADLLMAEHVAASLLNRHGIPAARTSIVRGGRAFLEVTRFDRTGAHGRRNIVSLSSLSAAFYGELMAPWTQIASTLEADGWITPEDARRMALLWWFGTLIGNTDMHYGNLSFYLTPGRPLRLAPAYDMLPMFYRPDLEGRLPDRQLSPAPPPPEQIDTWSRAIEIAIEFWRAVADEQEISREFRTIAGRSLEALAKQRRQFG